MEPVDRAGGDGLSGSQSVFLGTTLVSPGQGGIAVVARLTARALVSMGLDVEMLSLLDEKPVEVAGVSCQMTKGNQLTYLLHCHKAALMHQRFIYDSIGVARAHPRIGMLKRPYAVWMHGIEAWYHLNAERERALRQAGLVLVNSQFTLEKFQELHFTLENARVCPLATEHDEPPGEFPDFSGPPTVLILGRQDKDNYYKGHRELIECWPKVVSTVPDARLVIAGGGDGLPLTRKLVAQSPVAERIEVLGFVPDEELPSLWKQAHVFAMPSRGEGFGLVYVEAMRHGLPVIASMHDAGQEVNQDGITGFNVNLDTQGELVERIVGLLSDSGLCQQLGRQAYECWRKNMRFSVFESRFVKVISDFL